MSRSPLTKIAQQERTRREILQKSDLIPPLPDVVARVLALLNDRNTEPHDLEQSLLLDQVLVAKILSMVNSPFYGLNREVGTVKGAIMVLGFKTLRSIVLASSTGKYMTRDYACYGHSDKGLWRHSLAVATLARTLTQLTHGNQEQREEMFIAGLLHDIGKLLVAPYLNERDVSVPTDACVDEFERETIGIDHAEAGSLVAAKWNLAPAVQEILRAHHSVDCPSELRSQLAIVRLADAAAHDLRIGYAADRVPAAVVRDSDLSAIGWSRAEWTAAASDLAESVDRSLASLNNLCA
jgi:putative nucleotidyltransferase with HDIG domain